MKRLSMYLSILCMGLLFVVNTGCEEEAAESCEQEEICEGKEVTACCEGDVCYYTYDGKKYQESEIAQLALDLNCTSAVNIEDLKLDDLKAELFLLVELARAQQ